MPVKLITPNWARTLHSKRITVLCADVPFSSGKLSWMSTFKQSLLIASSRMIERIKEKLDFGKRFLGKKSETMLGSLDLILVGRTFPLLRSNVLNIFPQLNLSFRRSSENINIYSSNLIIRNIKDVLYISRSREFAPQQAARHQTTSVIPFPPGNSRFSGVVISGLSRRLVANSLSLMVRNLTASAEQSQFKKGFFDSFPVRGNKGGEFQVIKPTLKKGMQTESRHLRESLHSLKTTTPTDAFCSLDSDMMEASHVQEPGLKKKLSTIKNKIFNLIHLHSHDIYRSGRTPAARLLVNKMKSPSADRMMPTNLTFIRRYRGQHEVFHKVHSASYPASSEFISRKVQRVEPRVNQKEIEKLVSEKVFKTLDKAIKKTVYQELKSDSNCTRHFTENIYSQLFNRIVLERERLGVI